MGRRVHALRHTLTDVSTHVKSTPSVSLQTFCEDYIRSRLDLEAGSAHQLRVACRLIDSWASRRVAVEELSVELVSEFLAHLTKLGRAAATVNGKRSTIITLWRAASLKKIVRPPEDWEAIPRRKNLRRLPTAWSTEQMRLIVEQCRLLKGKVHGMPRADWWTAFVLMLYDSGARLDAALQTTWEDLDLQRGFLRLAAEEAKTGIEQLVKLSGQTIEAIQQLPRITEHVWPHGRWHHALFRTLRQVVERAGLTCTRRDLFHKLRRTNATWTAVQIGLESASHQLGHTNTRMTKERYVDPRFLQVVRSADVLPRL